MTDCDKLVQSVAARLTDIRAAAFHRFYSCSGADLLIYFPVIDKNGIFSNTVEAPTACHSPLSGLVCRVKVATLAAVSVPGLFWIKLALIPPRLQSAESPLRSSRDLFSPVLKLFWWMSGESVNPGNSRRSCRLLLRDDKAQRPQILTSPPRGGERGPSLLWHRKVVHLTCSPRFPDKSER